MDDVRWSLEFNYAEASKRWEDGAVVFHPLSGDTFELSDLADDLLCCLDGQPPQTTESLIGQIAALYGDAEDLPLIVGDILQSLQDNQLVRVL
ncbi:HPr-rel-A system PqqD family peptide chaperone [Marinobacterium aestuariivivens]|uniref:HPr-rel-A system PqqD family peptide chaperone n=1 Tax=Marinobacterium aestuariivivens TaxID=1698799 RepID=A0ABW1ZVH7_9GAMM